MGGIMFKYIDLFAGAGGMSLGFDTQNFNQILSVEYDSKIAETYSFNFPNHKLLVEDISKISNRDIEQLVGKNKIDVIVGGPPCQGFSLAGKYGRSFIDDPRNSLFKEFLRFIEVVKPQLFIMENVSRMVSHNKGKTIEEIIIAIKELGYEPQYKVLQTANYGIPQTRQRVIIVGTKAGRFEYPEKINEMKTIKNAIEDLPALKSGEKSEIPNHIAMNHGQEMLKKMSYISDGGNRSEIPIELRPKSGDIRKYIRYNSNQPSVTITGDMRKIFHYSQNRALTSRELARLQTFPDDFIFKGTSICVQQQIGNAVPPKLAELLAIQAKKFLTEESRVGS